MEPISYIYASLEYAESFGKAVDLVARERKYLGATKGFPIEATRAFVGNLVKNHWPQYYAMMGEQVIGWCDITPNPYEGVSHVGNLGMGVLAEFRGKGIGKRLIDLALTHAKEESKLEKVELEVFESNSKAIVFYRNLGFVEEGRKRKSRKLDGIYDNVLLMGKFL